MLVGEKERQESKLLCSVCGGDLKDDGECTVCGAQHDLKDGQAVITKASMREAKKAFVAEVSKIPGVGPAKAELLFEGGYTSLARLAKATPEELAMLDGFGETLAVNVHSHLHSDAPVGDQRALEKWLKGEAEDLDDWLGMDREPSDDAPFEEESTAPPPETDEGMEADLSSDIEDVDDQGPPPPEEATDALKRWLLGDEEGLEAWLAQPKTAEERSKGQVKPTAEDVEVDALKAELTELKKALRAEMANVKDGNFDPIRYLEEIARLNRNLQDEIQHRRELEGELDHMKKSSVAVIKYVKTQKTQEEGPEVRRKLIEEKESRKRLEIEVKKLQSLLEQAQKELAKGLEKLPENAKAWKQAELRLGERETELRAKEEELKALEESFASRKVRQTEEELEQRLQAELAEKEREYLDNEAGMKKRIIELEGEVERLKIDAKLRAAAIELTSMPDEDIDEKLVKKATELQAREKELLLREEEIRKLREELGFKEEEIQKLKEPMRYKEEEMLRREEDLIYREKLLESEKRRVEAAKAQATNVEELALKERLESLKAEISKKEEEVRAREKYLKQKMEELRMREQGLIEEDIEAREEERRLEMKQEKAKTGTARLDDLLLGGFPFGSNVSIYGPPFIGKEVIVNAFVAEGLKKGLPALWVITDKTPDDIREEMEYVLPGYQEYEELGLVRYVDAYSKGMGSAEPDPNVRYIDDPTDHEAILRAVDETSKQLKAKHPNYRLAFRSISTLIAYLDPATTFRFLQPFAGRRKKDKAISLYVIEKGMHGEQEIQLLGSVMDGMLEFKVEQLKTFLSVKGVCDVQSRAWIQYMYSKQGLSIGSFSLDHIR